MSPGQRSAILGLALFLGSVWATSTAAMFALRGFEDAVFLGFMTVWTPALFAYGFAKTEVAVEVHTAYFDEVAPAEVPRRASAWAYAVLTLASGLVFVVAYMVVKVSSSPAWVAMGLVLVTWPTIGWAGRRRVAHLGGRPAAEVHVPVPTWRPFTWVLMLLLAGLTTLIGVAIWSKVIAEGVSVPVG